MQKVTQRVTLYGFVYKTAGGSWGCLLTMDFVLFSSLSIGQLESAGLRLGSYIQTTPYVLWCRYLGTVSYQSDFRHAHANGPQAHTAHPHTHNSVHAHTGVHTCALTPHMHTHRCAHAEVICCTHTCTCTHVRVASTWYHLFCNLSLSDGFDEVNKHVGLCPV